VKGAKVIIFSLATLTFSVDIYTGDGVKSPESQEAGHSVPPERRVSTLSFAFLPS